MRISISSLAWEPEDDNEVVRILHQKGIDAIDIVPGKYFPDLDNVEKQSILTLRSWWNERDIEIIGMQSLLFGTTGLNIFGDKDSKINLQNRLNKVFFIASHLGATKLAFGSPKCRDKKDLSIEAADQIAAQFFRDIGEDAKKFGLEVCLEPNPSQYGANFMLDNFSTVRVVKLTNHPSIRLQLDTGALTINQENPFEIIGEYKEFIGHIHISEPGLVSIGEGGTNHSECSKAFEKYIPKQIATIEMLSAERARRMDTINQSIETVINEYRNG